MSRRGARAPAFGIPAGGQQNQYGPRPCSFVLTRANLCWVAGRRYRYGRVASGMQRSSAEALELGDSGCSERDGRAIGLYHPHLGGRHIDELRTMHPREIRRLLDEPAALINCNDLNAWPGGRATLEQQIFDETK